MKNWWILDGLQVLWKNSVQNQLIIFSNINNTKQWLSNKWPRNGDQHWTKIKEYMLKKISEWYKSYNLVK